MDKFNKEIELLKNLSGKNDGSLHPLRKEQIKRALLATLNAENRRPEQRLIRPQNIKIRKTQIIKYVISTLIGISALAGTAFAANTPGVKVGNPLFPIKKLTENVQVALTTDVQAKAQLQEKIAEERLNDLIEIKNQVKAAADTAPELQNESRDKKQNQAGDNQTDNGRQDNSQRNNSAPVQTRMRLRAKTDLEVQASDEFSEAVNNLKRAQNKLKEKGHAAAAAEIQKNILKLQLKSEQDSDNTDQIDNERQNNVQPDGPGGENGSDGAQIQMQNHSDTELHLQLGR